jgi:hypothetical protein
MEQRENTKFVSREKKIATENFQILKQVYGDALSRTRVFEWYSRFRDGREHHEYDDRSGRPKPFEHLT